MKIGPPERHLAAAWRELYVGSEDWNMSQSRNMLEGREVFNGVGALTGEDMELAVENHVHGVCKYMPCMALGNIWVEV